METLYINHLEESSDLQTIPENLFGSRKKKKAAASGSSGSKGKKKEKKPIRGVGIALVAPFFVPMKAALKKKGIKSAGLQDTANKFYLHIIKGGKNFESLDGEKDNMAPIAINVLVDAILSFFRNLKAKKDSGKPLSPTEDALLKGAETAADNVKDELVTEGTSSIGKIALIAVGAFLLFKFVVK